MEEHFPQRVRAVVGVFDRHLAVEHMSLVIEFDLDIVLEVLLEIGLLAM